MKTPAALSATVCASLLLVSAALGATERRSVSAGRLVLSNLAGEIRAEKTSGPNFDVEVSILGRDAEASGIRVEVKEGDPAHLIVRFPTDKEDRFVYPAMGKGSRTTIRQRDGSGDGESLVDWIFSGGKGKVEIAGSGKGMQVWADVVVKVPVGAQLEILNGVGEITAAGVAGNLRLDNQSGSVHATDIAGAVIIDTGSGGVSAERVRGNLSVDTGSGSVEIDRCDADEIVVDTGSGNVKVSAVTCKSLSVDTGSGEVRATELAAESASIDTGSGSVELILVRCGAGPYTVDTGSGGIDMKLPADASATIEADTGSGGIRANLPGVKILSKEHDSISATMGDGKASISLSTGSGTIRLIG